MTAPSQLQIAKLAGVSRSTVAWALHPTRRSKLRPETLARVDRALRQLNYRPHRYAQIMRRGKSGIIGMLRFAGSSQMRAELEFHALQRIRKGNYKPMVIDATLAQGDVLASCEELLDAQIEGLILEGPNYSETQDVIEQFARAQVPTVILSGSEVPDTIHVRSDMRHGMAELTRHLIRLGHTRLTQLLKWVDPQIYRFDWWRNYDRVLGFADAIREAGGSLADPDGRLGRLSALNPEVGAFEGGSPVRGEVFFDEGEWNWFDPFREGRNVAERLLKRGDRPHALLCANDDWAIGAMAASAGAGLRIPHDIAVTGFDNYSVGAYLPVPLTTVTQPTHEKAEAAVRILLELIAGKRPSAHVVKLPTELVIRESCGAKLRRK